MVALFPIGAFSRCCDEGSPSVRRRSISLLLALGGRLSAGVEVVGGGRASVCGGRRSEEGEAAVTTTCFGGEGAMG